MANGNVRPQLDWSEIDTENVVHVRDTSDLPAPSGGTITLDNAVYKFDGFVSSTNNLDISNSPVFLGSHGSQDGFLHTGGQTALVGTDGGFFARDFFFSAPGGTMFDLTANQSTEMLVESCAFSDAANLGNIASLGTIDGYRVPTFKGCNFEEFDAGLTFDGSPDKIFISGLPIRNISASNVTIFTLASTIDVEILDVVGNYVKNAQSDTEVWRVESGGEPTLAFQYRGNTHDASVTKSNILTGPNIDKDAEPVYVEQSFPLADTLVLGEMHNDGTNTISISTQDTWTDVNITSIIDTAKRMIKESEGHQQYVGTKDSTATVNVNISFYGANGDIFTWGIALNQTDPLTQHISSVEARGKNANLALPVNASFTLETNDVVHMKVKNESGTNDPTILSYSFSVNGQ